MSTDFLTGLVRQTVNEAIMPHGDLRCLVRQVVQDTPVLDVHTHLYAVPFGELLLWGIDELLTYHYLAAEVLRVAPMAPDAFYAMSKREQADCVWQHLFVERSPISEACRGVLTCLQAFGLDVAERDLNAYREYFASATVEQHVEKVFQEANLSAAVMTMSATKATA